MSLFNSIQSAFESVNRYIDTAPFRSNAMIKVDTLLNAIAGKEVQGLNNEKTVPSEGKFKLSNYCNPSIKTHLIRVHYDGIENGRMYIYARGRNNDKHIDYMYEYNPDEELDLRRLTPQFDENNNQIKHSSDYRYFVADLFGSDAQVGLGQVTAIEVLVSIDTPEDSNHGGGRTQLSLDSYKKLAYQHQEA